MKGFSDGSFDLIFLDVHVPEMHRFEAIRHIPDAIEATGRHPPIVAMTAHAKAGDRERCLAAGTDDYLSKPLNKPELLALIGRISAGIAALTHDLETNAA